MGSLFKWLTCLDPLSKTATLLRVSLKKVFVNRDTRSCLLSAVCRPLSAVRCLLSTSGFAGLAILLILCGCTVKRPLASYPANKPTKQQTLPARTEPRPDKQPPPPSARALAALTFSDQGRVFLAENKPDDAIRALERAVTLYPYNGENYYYLAEAWLIKKNISQATEFNQLATIYFNNNPEWLAQTNSQRIRINRVAAP